MLQTAYFYPVLPSLSKIVGNLTFFREASQIVRNLGNFLTFISFYRGRALALPPAHRPYASFFVSSLRQLAPIKFNLDGFFFPYKTHGGYSFRPLGLFNNPQFASNPHKAKRLSLFGQRASSRFSRNAVSNSGQLCMKGPKLPLRLLAAIVRRRKRRTWAIRWAPTSLATRRTSLRFSSVVLSQHLRPSVRAPYASAWFLEAARFKPGLSTE